MKAERSYREKSSRIQQTKTNNSNFKDNRIQNLNQIELINNIRQRALGTNIESQELNNVNKWVVQRQVRVNNIRRTMIQVNNQIGPLSNARLLILQSWINTATIHNFIPTHGYTAWENLYRALVRVAAMPFAIPPLFTAPNLLFITHQVGRLPTLYFLGGGQTGRLRQQHDTGPLAKIDPIPRIRVSFANTATRGLYTTNLSTSARGGTPFVTPAGVIVNNPPVPGQFLLEYNLNAAAVAIHNWHISGGVIQNAPLIMQNNIVIGNIYNNIRN